MPRRLLPSALLVVMTIYFVLAGNSLWIASGKFSASMYFSLALTYVVCLVWAWTKPSSRASIVGIVATLLVFAVSLDGRSPRALGESVLVLVLLTYFCWVFFSSLGRARLAAKRSHPLAAAAAWLSAEIIGGIT
jgi:hypothetical protein